MTTDYPIVELRTHTPLQDYFKDREGNKYSVARLLDDARDLPVFDCPLVSLNLEDIIWQGSNLVDLSFHVKACMNADLEYPILLDWLGGIADGRHRIIKAIALGHTTIKAKRLQWQPAPDVPYVEEEK